MRKVKIRPPLGIEAAIVVCVFFFMVVLTVFAPREADAATFPFYNLGGYSTTLRVTNTTGADVVWSGPYLAGFPNMEPAYATSLFPMANIGGGVFGFTLPAGLSATVEITEPNGGRVRIPELALNTSGVQLQDLAMSGESASIFVSTQADLVIDFYRDSSFKSSVIVVGGSAILPVPTGSNRAIVRPPSVNQITPPGFFVFAFHRRLTAPYAFQSIVLATEIK